MNPHGTEAHPSDGSLTGSLHQRGKPSLSPPSVPYCDPRESHFNPLFFSLECKTMKIWSVSWGSHETNDSD